MVDYYIKYQKLSDNATDTGHRFFKFIFSIFRKIFYYVSTVILSVIIYILFFILGMFVNEKTKYID